MMMQSVCGPGARRQKLERTRNFTVKSANTAKNTFGCHYRWGLIDTLHSCSTTGELSAVYEKRTGALTTNSTGHMRLT